MSTERTVPSNERSKAALAASMASSRVSHSSTAMMAKMPGSSTARTLPRRLSRFFGFQNIPKTAIGRDADARVLQSLAQAVNQHIHRSAQHVILVRKHTVDDLLARQGLAAVLQEVLQQ